MTCCVYNVRCLFCEPSQCLFLAAINMLESDSYHYEMSQKAWCCLLNRLPYWAYINSYEHHHKYIGMNGVSFQYLNYHKMYDLKKLTRQFNGLLIYQYEILKSFILYIDPVLYFTNSQIYFFSFSQAGKYTGHSCFVCNLSAVRA